MGIWAEKNYNYIMLLHRQQDIPYHKVASGQFTKYTYANLMKKSKELLFIVLKIDMVLWPCTLTDATQLYWSEFYCLFQLSKEIVIHSDRVHWWVI